MAVTEEDIEALVVDIEVAMGAAEVEATDALVVGDTVADIEAVDMGTADKCCL